MTTADRILSRIDRSAGPDACHPWVGSHVDGYGRARVDGRMQLITRWLLARELGRPLLPDPVECALHTCDNPPCCNLRHLYVGDRAQNSEDAKSRGRVWNPTAREKSQQTHCVQGHAFTPENTYTKGNGCRQCRQCNTERKSRARAA